MKTQKLNRSDSIVHRYGTLLSAAIALLFCIGVFAATHNAAIALICAVPIGVTLGVAFAESANSRPLDPKRRAALALALLVGTAVLIALAVLAA